jgi:hypothetical protein
MGTTVREDDPTTCDQGAGACMGNTAEDEMKYTINELANSKGVSQPVREALLHMEAELDATNRQVEILSDALAESRREVAALKAVREDWGPGPHEVHSLPPAASEKGQQ